MLLLLSESRAAFSTTCGDGAHELSLSQGPRDTINPVALPGLSIAKNRAPRNDEEDARRAGELFVAHLAARLSPSEQDIVALPPHGALRDVASVWAVAAAHSLPPGVTLAQWKQCDDGARAALAAVGLVLVPGSVQAPPTQHPGKALSHSYRLVEVWRGGKTSCPPRRGCCRRRSGARSTRR